MTRRPVVARAALDAMACFPTTMMIEAGKDALTELAEPTDDEMRFVWLEIINAALTRQSWRSGK